MVRPAPAGSGHRSSGASPWRVLVVVPARDEEATLAACLDSVRAAVARLGDVRPDVHVDSLVVLDSCEDGTADVLASYPEVGRLVVSVRAVGAARYAGTSRVRRCLAGHPTTRAWLACTDADGEVPTDWLETQLAHADAGAHAVLGMVRPGPGLPTPVLEQWLAAHPPRPGHPHVHGANLGVRLDRYDAAGGFAPLAEHEDAGLVARLEANDDRVVRTAQAPVTTSARTVGRTPGGFAGHLAALQAVAAATPEVSRAAG